MGPLKDIREAGVRNTCREQAWLLASTYLRHLDRQAFNAALEELSRLMSDTILKHPPPVG